MPRREFLWRFGGGLGGVALGYLLGQHHLLAETQPLPGTSGAPARADLNGGLHHRAKGKRVVQLFMNGGASQGDTLHYKPEVTKTRGEKVGPGPKVKSPRQRSRKPQKSPRRRK